MVIKKNELKIIESHIFNVTYFHMTVPHPYIASVRVLTLTPIQLAPKGANS